MTINDFHLHFGKCGWNHWVSRGDTFFTHHSRDGPCKNTTFQDILDSDREKRHAACKRRALAHFSERNKLPIAHEKPLKKDISSNRYLNNNEAPTCEIVSFKGISPAIRLTRNSSSSKTKTELFCDTWLKLGRLILLGFGSPRFHSLRGHFSDQLKCCCEVHCISLCEPNGPRTWPISSESNSWCYRFVRVCVV